MPISYESLEGNNKETSIMIHANESLGRGYFQKHMSAYVYKKKQGKKFP